MATATKICKDCNNEYPLTAVHWHIRKASKDGYNHYCKACTGERSKRYGRASRQRGGRISGDVGTRLAVPYLAKHGIYADYGKNTRYKYVDVMAWGCVKIEVKLSQNHVGKDWLLTSVMTTGAWSFKMYSANNKDTLTPDVIMLICDRGDGSPSYHLLPYTHPVFYRKDGVRKINVSYQEYETKSTWMFDDFPLSWMDESRDNLALIESVRQRVIQDLERRSNWYLYWDELAESE